MSEALITNIIFFKFYITIWPNYNFFRNLFEDLTRLLLQNAFPLGGLLSTHILSLEALLTVVDTIERNCVSRQADALNFMSASDLKGLTMLPVEKQSQLRLNRMSLSAEMPTMSEIIDQKKQKQIVTEASELFNSNPGKGIEFLFEKGILKNPIVPTDVANWLRFNPRLDKNKIADYICK